MGRLSSVIARLHGDMDTEQRSRPTKPADAMKTLIAVAGLAIALMFVVTSCSDRTRHNCTERPTAERCNP